MSTNPQFDLFGSKAARDEAVSRVVSHSGSFMDDGMAAIGRLTPGRLLTGEDVRLILYRLGIRPHHHNAWGGLIRFAVQRKLLVPTGRWFPMKDISSHARKTPEYRVI